MVNRKGMGVVSSQGMVVSNLIHNVPHYKCNKNDKKKVFCSLS